MGKVYSCIPPDVDRVAHLASRRGKSQAPDLAGHRVAPCFARFTRVPLSAVAAAHNDWRRSSQQLALDPYEYEVLVRQICPEVTLRQIFMQVELARSRTGKISCLDFFGGITLLCHDTLPSKLQFIFRLYDFGSDGILTPAELVILVSSCLRGFCTMKRAPVATFPGIVKLANEACATRGSHPHGLTFADFLGWCKEEGAMLFLVEGLDSSSAQNAEALTEKFSTQRAILSKLANVEAKLHSLTWKPTTIDDYWFGTRRDNASRGGGDEDGGADGENARSAESSGPGGGGGRRGTNVGLDKSRARVPMAPASSRPPLVGDLTFEEKSLLFTSVAKMCGTLFTHYNTILNNLNAAPSGPLVLDWLSLLDAATKRRAGKSGTIGVSVTWLNQVCTMAQRVCPAMHLRQTTAEFWKLAQERVLCLADYFGYEEQDVELDALDEISPTDVSPAVGRGAPRWGSPDTIHTCDIVSFAQWMCDVERLTRSDARKDLKMEYVLLWTDVAVRWMVREELNRWHQSVLGLPGSLGSMTSRLAAFQASKHGRHDDEGDIAENQANGLTSTDERKRDDGIIRNENENNEEEWVEQDPVPMRVDIQVGAEVGGADTAQITVHMRTDNAGLRVDMDGLDNKSDIRLSFDDDSDSNSEEGSERDGENDGRDSAKDEHGNDKHEHEDEEEGEDTGAHLIEMGKWLYAMVMEDVAWTNDVCDAYIAVDLHVHQDHTVNDAISKVHKLIEVQHVADVVKHFCVGVVAIARNNGMNTSSWEQQSIATDAEPAGTPREDSAIRIYFFLPQNTQTRLERELAQIPLLHELFLTKYIVHGVLDISIDLNSLHGSEDQGFRQEALWEGGLDTIPVKPGHEDYKIIQAQRRMAVDLGKRGKTARRQGVTASTTAAQSAAVQKDQVSNHLQELSALGQAMVEQIFDKYDTAKAGALDVTAVNRMQSGIGSTVFHSEQAFHALLREYDVPTDDKGDLTLAGLLHLYTNGKPEQLAEDLWALGLGRYKGDLSYHVKGTLHSLATLNGEGEALIAQQFASFAEAFALAREKIDLTTMPGVVATQLRALFRVLKVLSGAGAWASATSAANHTSLPKAPPFVRQLQAMVVLAEALCALPFEHGPDCSSSVMMCTRDGLMLSCELDNLHRCFAASKQHEK